MPAFNPSTHDDLIDITITLGTPAGGTASFSKILVLVADVTPGGGKVLSYANQVEVDADVTATNLNAIAAAITAIMFGQANPPDEILIGGVAVTASAETYVEALDAIIDLGTDFYGIIADTRTAGIQVLLGVDVEDKADTGSFYIFGFQSDDADWLTTGGVPAAFGTLDEFERSVAYFHDDNGADAASDRLEAAHFADRLAFDADVQSAGWNAAVAQVDDLTTPLTQTQKQFARTNNANTALPFGTTTDTYVDTGHNLNNRPVDHIVSADWLRQRLNEDIADLMVEVSARGTKITVDAQGQSLIGNVIDARFALGVLAQHFLDFEVTPEPITQDDIDNQRVRFSGQAQLASSVRQVQISLFFDTGPIG